MRETTDFDPRFIHLGGTSIGSLLQLSYLQKCDRSSYPSIPVAAMAAWLASLLIAIRQAPEVTLAVTGYDPRDLLSGHYLRYQIDFGMNLPANDRSWGQDLCACLTENTDGIAKAHWLGACSERDAASCPLFIRGQRDWRGMHAGIERYYIPEQYQHALAQVPSGATIKARVTSDGTAYVTDMYVEHTPVLEWASEHGS